MIEDIIRRAEQLGLGPTHGGPKGGFRIFQNPNELAVLTLLLRWRSIGTYCEIGVGCGGMTRWLHQEAGGFTRAVLLDDGSHLEKRTENLKAIPQELWTLFNGDSHSDEAREFLKNNAPDRGFHTVLVDGDHTRLGVQLDTELILPFCHPDAWVLFHDTAIRMFRSQGRMLPIRVREYLDSPQFPLHELVTFVGAAPAMGITICRMRGTT